MAHLVFAALGGHGHVTPTLPLVSELVRRGHRVEYACGPDFGDAVGAAGATWVPVPGLPPFHPPSQPRPEVVAAWFRHFFAAHVDTYPVLLDHVAADPPEAIVYDQTNWPARLVARRLGVPAVRTVPNLAQNATYSGVGDALTDGLDDQPVMRALADDVATFAAEHDVELDVAATIDVTEDLNLVFVPRAFQPAGASFDARFRFLGPVLGERLAAEHWSSPNPGLPVLYVSLGSIFTDHPTFYRSCLEAFGDGRYQVAMTLGGTDPDVLGPVPPTVQLQAWCPQLAVLQHARAFLTHAGMNSTMEALWSGVPLIALPQMPEQAVNADRIVELGLGVRLDPTTLTAETLRAALDDLVDDPAVRSAVDAMRTDAHAGGGATGGADAIEEHLGVIRTRSS